MDCTVPAPSHSPASSEGLLTPRRSPSRLDFCEGDRGSGHSPTGTWGWSRASFPGHFTDIPVDEEDPFALDIAPPAHPYLLIAEDPTDDDPPYTADSHAHETTDTPTPFFADPEEPEDMNQVVSMPQAPIPVRPPSAQNQPDVEEFMPPPRPASQRLNYPHRGFSRSALHHHKSLWNSRHEEWAEWQSRMEKSEAQSNDAYTGITTPSRVVVGPPPYTRTPPSGLERDKRPKKHAQNARASIYPRVGDISALRDPYSVSVDRSFHKLPLWTLNKALYAFDMQRRFMPLAPSASAFNVMPVQASTSSSTLSSYSSLGSADDEDSDSTLVADDSLVQKTQLYLGPLENAPSPQSPPAWNRLYEWGLSWYARWELLIGIFQRDHTRHNAFDYSAKSVTPLGPLLSPLGQIFHFPFGDGRNDNVDNEASDYGTLVADSSFSADFDEECERALAFYHRELAQSEATS